MTLIFSHNLRKHQKWNNMTIQEVGGSIHVQFDYHPKIVADIKLIPGRRWNSSQKVWIIPKRESKRVQEFAQRHNALPSDAPMQQMDYTVPPLPELNISIPLKRDLYPYQRKGVAYSLEKKRLIIGDQPGLGKTAQSIATIVAANQFPCLIICPSSLKINWQREWEMWTSKKALILKDSIKNTWPMFYEHGLADVYITNYESLKKYFVKEINKKGKRLLLKDIVFKNEISMFKSVIIDELHKVKDPTTQQTKFVKGICTGKEWILGLTGTPVVNKPRDLFAQLGIIERIKDFGGYKGFLNRYCEGYNGAKNLEELNYILNKQCFYRREKSEVLQDLPSKVRQVVICEINNRREYQDAENDLANYLKSYKQKSDDEVEKSMRGEIMVRIGILKNISARGKLADVMSYIDDVVDAGEKIVVFVHLRDVAEVIQKHYPGSVSVLGKDSQSERQQSIDAFQNDPSVKVIVCSIKAAGVGLTLTAASRVAFVEQSWHAADHEQCEDRCHRIGQKDSVQCTYFLGKDTIDEKIYKMIEEKRTISDTITGATNQTEVNVIDNIINLFNQK